MCKVIQPSTLREAAQASAASAPASAASAPASGASASAVSAPEDAEAELNAFLFGDLEGDGDA